MSEPIVKKRGPGRPPGKKKIVSYVSKKPLEELILSQSQFLKRKRTVPNRLLGDQLIDLVPQKQITSINAADSKPNSQQTDLQILKRPRGRPPLSASRGGRFPIRGRIGKSTTRGGLYAAYYGTESGLYSEGFNSGHLSSQSTKKIIVSQITQHLLSWLMTHEPQSISDLLNAVSLESDSLIPLDVTSELIQAILDILQVLGIVSVVRHVSSSDSNHQPKITISNEHFKPEPAESNESSVKIETIVHEHEGQVHNNPLNLQKLYCMHGFAKSIEARFQFSSLRNEIEKKKIELLHTKARVTELKELSSNMYKLTPEERIEAFKSKISELMNNSPLPAVSASLSDMNRIKTQPQELIVKEEESITSATLTEVSHDTSLNASHIPMPTPAIAVKDIPLSGEGSRDLVEEPGVDIQDRITTPSHPTGTTASQLLAHPIQSKIEGSESASELHMDASLRFVSMKNDPLFRSVLETIALLQGGRKFKLES